MIEMPARVARLPRDRHGRPVPWFVAWIDGAPDFRIVAAGRGRDARRFDQCWICGGQMGAFKTFVIGPMCAVNRVSAEPPSHTDCAIYAARACPFLSTPAMVRRSGAKPAGYVDPPGIMCLRNPGVALAWTVRRYSTFDAPDGGVLFDVGEALEARWYAEGREATRAEVLAAIDSGLPLLRAEADKEGPRALAELERQTAVAMRLVPA